MNWLMKNDFETHIRHSQRVFWRWFTIVAVLNLGLVAFGIWVVVKLLQHFNVI